MDQAPADKHPASAGDRPGPWYASGSSSAPRSRRSRLGVEAALGCGGGLILGGGLLVAVLLIVTDPALLAGCSLVLALTLALMQGVLERAPKGNRPRDRGRLIRSVLAGVAAGTIALGVIALTDPRSLVVAFTLPALGCLVGVAAGQTVRGAGMNLTPGPWKWVGLAILINGASFGTMAALAASPAYEGLGNASTGLDLPPVFSALGMICLAAYPAAGWAMGAFRSMRARSLAAIVMALSSAPTALELFSTGSILFVFSPVLFPIAIAFGALPWLLLTLLRDERSDDAVRRDEGDNSVNSPGG